MGYNLESSFSRKITLSGKHNVKMTPSWVLKNFRTARYHRLYRYICFNGKDGLSFLPNVRFYDAQIS